MTYKERVEGVLSQQFEAILVQTDIQGRHFWEADKKQVKEATTQIINLIESVIPKKLPDSSICNCCDECGNSVPWEAGYNQAIEDIKSKLIDGEDNDNNNSL